LRGIKLGEAFLDTTFMLPFFHIDVDVEGFDLGLFESFISGLERVHFSEISVVEAKAKIMKLSERNAEYRQVQETFGENLEVLRNDEKIRFHAHDGVADRVLNSLLVKGFKLDVVDLFIVSQAAGVGFLLTEDRKILRLRDEARFRDDAVLGGLRLARWSEVQLG